MQKDGKAEDEDVIGETAMTEEEVEALVQSEDFRHASPLTFFCVNGFMLMRFACCAQDAVSL
jgi:hypothetical protein